MSMTLMCFTNDDTFVSFGEEGTDCGSLLELLLIEISRYYVCCPKNVLSCETMDERFGKGVSR